MTDIAESTSTTAPNALFARLAATLGRGEIALALAVVSKYSFHMAGAMR